MRPPLKFVRLKEVDELMETPPQNVVVYFTVWDNANVSCKGQIGWKILFQQLSLCDSLKRIGLEYCPHNSQSCCLFCRVWIIRRRDGGYSAVMSDVFQPLACICCPYLPASGLRVRMMFLHLGNMSFICICLTEYWLTPFTPPRYISKSIR